MQSLGNRVTLMVIIMLLQSSFVVVAQEPLDYYICSYHTPTDSTSLDFKKIDLVTKTIVDSINIDIVGELAFKTPVIISRNDRNYFLVLVTTGEIGKNSWSDREKMTLYAIVDDHGVIVRTAALRNVAILNPYGYIDSRHPDVRFLVYANDSTQERVGRFAFDNAGRLSISHNRPYIFNEADFPRVGPFRYFKQISPLNDTLFRDWSDHSMYLVRLDSRRNMVLDSVSVGDPGHFSFIFGLGQGDSLVYLFALNSSYVGLADTTYYPSYKKIFSSHSLSVIDSIEIGMPDINNGYILNEIGDCDRVGPYLVYYYFAQESYAYFSPAMLFIFDTRTNEATWLRVGWR